MKLHRTKEQCFELSGLPEESKQAFYMGWYSAGSEINRGWDSDLLQENLLKYDFLKSWDDEE